MLIFILILSIAFPVLFLYCCLVVASRSDRAMQRYLRKEIIKEHTTKSGKFLITHNPNGKYWMYHYLEDGTPISKTFFDFKDLQNFTKEREKYMTKVKDLVEKYGNREVDEVELEKILKPVKKTIYNLELGDKYFIITTSGKTELQYWDNGSFDHKRLAMGNVFLTREDAEFKAEYLKVKAELKRYASMCEEPVDWKIDSQTKYCVYYDCSYYELNIKIGHKYFAQENNVYFTDKSILEQAIEEIGEERIKKYYLGVK